MRLADKWTPTKYEIHRGRLRASRSPRHVAVSSRLHADLVAAEYDTWLPRVARGRLLDLGCGTAPLYGSYREQARTVIAVDWPSSLHEGRHVDVWADLGHPLPFRTGSVDTVISSDVLEHLPTPDQAMAEIARVLSPGGHLVLNSPFLYRVHEAPHDFLRHTRYSLERLAEVNGLEVVALTEVGGVVEVLGDLWVKLLEQVPLAGRLLAAGSTVVISWFGTTSLGRLARRLTCQTFPLAHFLVARRV
jgi:SAM-dependent methyltransferase